MSYCDYVKKLSADAIKFHQSYHDNQYGFPIHSDDELFCRLVLEINQAGLNWTTILKKQDSFRKAYSNFKVDKVANYDEVDIDRLLTDSGVIRNKLKIHAAVENAKSIIQLQKDFGSFKTWLDFNRLSTKEEWLKIFKKTFKFTGGEIVNEFLVSTGYLPGSHDYDCPVYAKILQAKPAWLL